MSTVSSRFESSFRGGLCRTMQSTYRGVHALLPHFVFSCSQTHSVGEAFSRETEALISFDRTHVVAAAPSLSTLRAPILRWCTRETEARRARDSSIPSQFLSLLSRRGARQARNRCIGPSRMPRSGQRMQESPRQHNHRNHVQRACSRFT